MTTREAWEAIDERSEGKRSALLAGARRGSELQGQQGQKRGHERRRKDNDSLRGVTCKLWTREQEWETHGEERVALVCRARSVRDMDTLVLCSATENPSPTGRWLRGSRLGGCTTEESRLP